MKSTLLSLVAAISIKSRTWHQDGLTVDVHSFSSVGGVCRDSDTVSTIYTGRLASDGTVFDKSELPFHFILGQGDVIPCWDTAFAQMQIGEKATIQCPASMAYGELGAGPKIPPNAALNFDVEVVDCEATDRCLVVEATGTMLSLNKKKSYIYD